MADDIQPPPAPPAEAESKPRRPWRDNLEAFGVAILMAVLLKPMVVEAYQIPTPSMQPTLMGSPEAGIHDRILVDKVRYTIFEPKRWDIAVFRYPIRRNQNYVKRIVGVPGDRLRIAGGNLWQVAPDGDIAAVVRKPDRIQRDLWKEIYPARRLLDGSERVLDYFNGPIGRWQQDGEDLVVRPSAKGLARLKLSGNAHKGLTNQIYDGYPTWIARLIREEARGNGGQHGVQDARIRFTLTPEQTVEALRVDLLLEPAAMDRRRYRLEITGGGTGALVVARRSLAAAPADFVEKARAEFAASLPAGRSTEVAFAHIDDRLLAFIDGVQVCELEVGKDRVTERLEPGQSTLQIEAASRGPMRFAEIAVWRDLHYTPTGLEDDPHLGPLPKHVIEVPEAHFMMMGDNTLASADARQWKTIRIGVKDGWLVDPSGNPDGVRIMDGNRRPWSLQTTPDPDENPVIVRRPGNEPDIIVFTDADGEVHRLEGKVAPGHSPERILFGNPGGDGGSWTPPEKHVYFVPREHILGRPVLRFWPASRIGFVR